MRGPVVIGGDNLPSPVGIGLTDLPNIGAGPPGPPPGSGTTVFSPVEILCYHILELALIVSLKTLLWVYLESQYVFPCLFSTIHGIYKTTISNQP